jgi:putative endopeptidase
MDHRNALMLILALSAGCVQKPDESATASVTAPEATKSQKPQLGTWGFDTTAMDPRVRPGDDFNRYANGTWMDRAIIPDDRSQVSMFSELATRVEKQVQTILEQFAQSGGAAPGSNAQILGDWYASHMDEAAIEKAGYAPLNNSIAGIQAISSVSDLSAYLGSSYGKPGSSILSIWFQQDPKQSTRVVPVVALGTSGLSLQERDAYLDPSRRERLKQYQAHLEKTFSLIGFPDAARRAAAVVALEREMATAALPADQVDPFAFHAVAPARLAAEFPGLDWKTVLAAADLDAQPLIYTQQPSALAGLSKLATPSRLTAWRDYLTYQYVKGVSEALPVAMRDEQFDFYVRSVGLQGKPVPRQRATLDFAMNNLARFLNEEYAKRYVSPEARAAASAMVEEIREAFDARLAGLDWISDGTRKEARRKLAATTPMIGYPDLWPEAADLRIVRGDALGNLERIALRRGQVERAKLDQPVDRKAWDPEMGVYWAGATADASKPLIMVTGGILQPPFFDANADAAANYGGLGAVVAHEFIHLFDNMGSRFDADGNERNWFAEPDALAFKQRSERLVAQMSGYEVLPGIRVDGKATLFESMPDQSGLRIALDAYHRSLNGAGAPVIDGYTGEQRFFLAFAQNWRSKYRDERLKADVTGGDFHPPLIVRPFMVRNVDEWYASFDVKPGDKLYLAPEERVQIW